MLRKIDWHDYKFIFYEASRANGKLKISVDILLIIARQSLCKFSLAKHADYSLKCKDIYILIREIIFIIFLATFFFWLNFYGFSFNWGVLCPVLGVPAFI